MGTLKKANGKKTAANGIELLDELQKLASNIKRSTSIHHYTETTHKIEKITDTLHNGSIPKLLDCMNLALQEKYTLKDEHMDELKIIHENLICLGNDQASRMLSQFQHQYHATHRK
jgi:hypothetical protein